MIIMRDLLYDECYLASHGYRCEAEIKASYRGSTHLSKVVTAKKDGQVGFVFVASHEDAQHFLRLRSIQDAFLGAAKIVDVIENRVFIVERAPGTLLWHIEDGLPEPESFRSALDAFVGSLEQVGLVHGDLRPWNVFYDPRKGFTVIDWGFSFFTGDSRVMKMSGHFEASRHKQPFLHVDKLDADRIVQLVEGRIGWEDAWGHPNEITWGPPWAKRKS
jgi:hypothetical protein